MTAKSRLSRRSALTGALGLGLATALPLRANQGEEELIFNADNLLPGEFTWHPERSPTGAVAVIVSLPEQLVHVYRNGVRIAVSTCSTGKKGHRTPTGVFTVLQKDKDHRSSTYNSAPMPNMNRLTWDGIALHAGHLPGYPASHGCVRLPFAFSERLWTVTHYGTPVIIAGARNDPWELVHPGLLLDGSAEADLSVAVDALAAKKHPSDWTEAEAQPVTTVLVTSADRRVVLIENGEELADGELTIEGPATLGEHVFLLQHPGAGDDALVWHGLTHHPDPAAPLAQETRLLDRIRAPKAFTAQMQARMHPGMTLIVSDLPSTPDRRSGKDFVIMAGENLTSPRPKIRGDEVPTPSPSRG
ncbi:L,D-transpeptidase [Aliiruegeria haliotis]|nr:L,D-transpeptidase [Aliiruegeria haliotis]